MKGQEVRGQEVKGQGVKGQEVKGHLVWGQQGDRHWESRWDLLDERRVVTPIPTPDKCPFQAAIILRKNIAGFLPSILADITQF